MTVLQATVLGFVQGLTEFLPVSSSGHLILVPKIFGWPDQGLSFDAVIHLGTALAAIWFFRQDIKLALTGLFTRTPSPESASMRKSILISMIPAVIVGLFFRDFIESSTRGAVFVACNLIIWSFVLLAADWFSSHKPAKTIQPNWRQAIAIGVAQAFALLPGTSRSGATISAGILSGVDRAAALRFSFVAGIPLILAAGGLSAIELLQEVSSGQATLAPLVVGFLASFFGGFLAIKLLLALINRRGLTMFAIYRIVLAIIVLLLLR
jgi:undecaprenyl-diphosphatase